MRRFFSKSLLVLPLAGLLTVTSVANAHGYRNYPPPGRWHDRGHGGYHRGPGGAIIGGLVGMAIGAGVVGMVARPAYGPRPMVYGPPPPVVYAPPPVAYAPPVVVYQRPAVVYPSYPVY